MDAWSMYLTVALLVIPGSSSYGRDATTMDRTPASVAGKRHQIEFVEEIHFHRDNARLIERCRSEADVRGCTDFPSEKLDCRCVSDDGYWVITATARLRATIHVSTPKVLMHERQHLADLQSSLDRHLSQVLEIYYPDGAVRSMKARVMSSPQYLRDVMNRFREESNRKFRCS